MIDWKGLTPQMVSKYISFKRDDINWIYKDEKDMPSLQAEGVAGICQRLTKYKIAFLADEVGMGKTMQAFGVMSMLWREGKFKKARILVFAPRREVALQWEREYKDFFLKHKKDSLIIPDARENIIVLDRLIKKNDENWLGNVSNKQLVIVKTTSLSYLSKDKDTYEEELSQLVSEIGKFDLLIIDEAQYFRNKSDSYRTKVSTKLFKDLAYPVLLMSATPNHSSSNDLNNIISYFDESLSIDSRLWDKIIIRRFRVLSKKEYIKYNYRREKEVPAFFEKESIDKNEIFFALYQKQLLEESLKIDMSKGQEFWRYLEGTEFDPKQFDQLLSKDDDNEDVKSNDHETAEDRVILKDIVSKFKHIYKESPENPKYKRTRDELLSKDYKNQTKSLVFSRRIPSVKELAKGIVSEYDQTMWRMIKKELGGRGDIPNREKFEQRCKRIIKQKKDDDEDMAEDETKNENVYSEVLSWFRIIPGKSTEASRFVRRFDVTSKHEDRHFFEMGNPKSFWTFDIEIKNLILKLDFSNEEKVGLENLIRKAARYASIGIVELFCCHIFAAKKKKDFFYELTKRWNNNSMKLRIEIIDMIKNFRLFYTKVIGISEDDLLKGKNGKPYEWNEFDNALPVYAYTASSRNESVLKRFNSPFFPNTLISTSVLQEGVNLQFFCDKVLHYGIAWTPGDDEQRIGRLDRMLSLTERNLDNDEESFLDISYPFLEKTHDEKRLAGFLIKKRDAEIFLDKGEILPANSYKESTNDIPIKSLLRVPQINYKKKDPYPWDSFNSI